MPDTSEAPQQNPVVPDDPQGDDDEVVGCDADFNVMADDDETAALRALFPQGEDSPTSAEQWQAVLGGE